MGCPGKGTEEKVPLVTAQEHLRCQSFPNEQVALPLAISVGTVRFASQPKGQPTLMARSRAGAISGQVGLATGARMSLSRLCAMQISDHSADTFACPRRRNCRNCRANFIWPKTGSTTCLRSL